MYKLSTETIIPKYLIEPDRNTGNSMFKIAKAKCSVTRQLSDFLIPHRKDYYFFVFVREGMSRHWIDMTPYTLKPDTFYFTIPQQVHLKEEAKPLMAPVSVLRMSFWRCRKIVYLNNCLLYKTSIMAMSLI